MRKMIFALALLLPSFAFAAGSGYPLDKANIDLADNASLQNGAKLFMNYCLGCHSMKYQRYQRTFTDLGIPDELGQQYLQFTGEKVSDYISRSMPEESAAVWFGAAPPDLTLVARVRGTDWLYTYLRTFYEDDSRPFGVNNKVFPDVGMPHVLAPLQSSLTPEQYDKQVLDLVNFLEYSGEPARLDSERIGKWVLAFIVVLFIFVYLLKKDYWRDLH